MARKIPDEIDLSPEETVAMVGGDTQALMNDIVVSCKRHGVAAISVCAFTDQAGALTFSTGSDPEWRELARMLALRMGNELGQLLNVEPRISGPFKIQGPR